MYILNVVLADCVIQKCVFDDNHLLLIKGGKQ